MTPIRIGVIAVIILLLIYPHVAFRYSFSDMPVKVYTDCVFQTGDIIMTKFDNPCIFFAKNGFNLKPTISNNITESLQYYSQGHYTHCGVVIVLDQPYIYHMTDDICYDAVTNTYKIGTPTLVSMRDMIGYHGLIYHHARKGSFSISSEVAKQMIGTFNQHMQGNPFKTVLTNGLKIIKSSDCKYDCKYVCTDFARDVLTRLGVPHNIQAQPTLVDFSKHCKETCDPPVIIRTVWYDHVIDY